MVLQKEAKIVRKDIDNEEETVQKIIHDISLSLF